MKTAVIPINKKPGGMKNAQQDRKKLRNKKGKKHGQRNFPVAKAKRDPVFIYLCDCHGEQAKKTPCERRIDDKHAGKYSETSLGTWRCSVTKRKCKVKRHRNKPTEPATAVETLVAA